MKYLNRITGEVIDVTEHAGSDGQVNTPAGVMWLGTGDRLVKRASGAHEGYQSSHPFWADYDEIVQTRVVRVVDGQGARYHAERLTGTGWVRGAARTTQAQAEADTPTKPVETVVKTSR